MATTSMRSIATLLALSLTALTGCAEDEPLAPASCNPGWARDGSYHSATGLADLAGYTRLRGDLLLDAAGTDQVAHLACLESIEGDLIITASPDLQDLRALAALTDVWGTLTIAANPRLTSLTGLERLELVGEMDVSDNPVLRELSGPGNLEAIARLDIVNNDALQDLSGVDQLERIGALTVSDNDALAIVHLPVLDLIAEDLAISTNGQLRDLSMPGLTTLGGDLAIQWNPTLPSCRAEQLVAQCRDGGFTGVVHIEGNDDAGSCSP